MQEQLEKILEEINQEKLKHWDSSERLDTDKLIGWCFDRCIDIIRKHMNDGWIPAKEKPTEGGLYVVTMSGSLVDQEEPFVGLADFEDGEWFDGDDVIAWRPLPEPYRPERSEG